jgi:hypothetical protein
MKHHNRPKVTDMHPSIGTLRTFRRLASTIRKYESDTFSASAARLSIDEASRIASRIVIADIEHRIQHLLDGLVITHHLQAIRNRTKIYR